MNKVKRLIISLGLSGILLIAAPTVESFAADNDDNLDSIPKESVTVEINDSISVLERNTKKTLVTMQQTYDTVYSTDYLNIRQRPTIQSKVVATVVPGAELSRIGTSNKGWDMIKFRGKYCYVYNKYISTEKPKTETNTALYGAGQFKRAGVIHWNGYRWTWYSQRVLPGGGLNIPGRHVDENGYVCDGDNYICLASNDLSKGTVVSTPFGKQGKIYDCGCASGTLDVYVNW